MKIGKAASFMLSALLLLLAPLGAAKAGGADPAAPAVRPAPVRTAPGQVVCLTIDDGFNGEMLKQELDLLRQADVQCTFFIVGCQLRKFPELWRQAIADGHEICYHTMYHRDVPSMSSDGIRKDIQAWNEAALEVLGQDYAIPKFARLPGGRGSHNKRVLELFDSLGYTIVCWSSDTLTGAVKRKKPIKKYIMDTTKPGSIILTHVNTADVSAMKQYVGWLSTNFQLVRISDALAPQPGAAPQSGPAPQPGAEPQPRFFSPAGYWYPPDYYEWIALKTGAKR